MVLDRRLRVMRKRRKRTLIKKIAQFSSLFDMDIAVLTRDKETGESNLYKSTVDENWPLSLDGLVMFSPAANNHVLLLTAMTASNYRQRRGEGGTSTTTTVQAEQILVST